MKGIIMKVIYAAMLVAILTLVGCGGGADTDISVADAKAEASSMTVDDLKAKAMEYKSAIEAKMEDLEPITAKLKEIPLTEQMGDEAKALQADIAALTGDLDALKERLAVYLDALKEQGESIKEYMN
jgi:septal ring factor EnvC (AmiA/AmiB activator)